MSAVDLQCPEAPAGTTHHLIPEQGEMRCSYCHLSDRTLTERGANRRWRAVLAIEGTVTSDGRLIEPTAVTWEDGNPVPLMRVNAGGEPDWSQPIIGYADRITREEYGTGAKIIGEGPLLSTETLPPSLGVGITLDGLEVAGNGVDYPLAVTSGRLRQVFVGGDPVWPECILEVTDAAG